MSGVQVGKGKLASLGASTFWPGGQHILAWCPFLIPKSDPWPTAWAISAMCPAFPGVQVGSALIAQPLQVLR